MELKIYSIYREICSKQELSHDSTKKSDMKRIGIRKDAITVEVSTKIKFTLVYI
jgi:hypothetical protein